MEKEKKNHAERNAEGHAESILELYRAFTALEDGAESVKIEGYDYTDMDSIRERAEEAALSVQVRSDWHTPGDSDGNSPTEFSILLSTGGPALRIIGDMGRHGSPEGEFTIQHQDWGTPWTDYRPDAANSDDWEDALDWFVNCFYFGE
jgi:hypothetical protein